MVIHSAAHARFYSAQSIFANCGCLVYAGSGNALGKLADGTDLNASNPTGASSGYPGSPSESFVEILAVEDIVSGELLFGLGKRTVGDHRRAVVHAQGGGRNAGLKRLGGGENTPPPGPLHYPPG